jgi:hypothetical protein
MLTEQVTVSNWNIGKIINYLKSVDGSFPCQPISFHCFDIRPRSSSSKEKKNTREHVLVSNIEINEHVFQRIVSVLLSSKKI